MTEEKQIIIGLGGVFFKSSNPKKLSLWYKENFGLYSRFEADKDEHLATLEWKDKDNFEPHHTVFGMFDSNTDYFDPSSKPFMFNFIVKNLADTIELLKSKGVTVSNKVDTFLYGKLGYLTDPEGNKIELWEPNELANS